MWCIRDWTAGVIFLNLQHRVPLCCQLQVRTFYSLKRVLCTLGHWARWPLRPVWTQLRRDRTVITGCPSSFWAARLPWLYHRTLRNFFWTRTTLTGRLFNLLNSYLNVTRLRSQSHHHSYVVCFDTTWRVCECKEDTARPFKLNHKSAHVFLVL